jgi:acyl-coenzyme A thioesterase PaaI-like protein
LGSVEGVFPGDANFAGYPGLLHGGMISSLLDGAMTNCLLALGDPGLTARLEVRFLKPVAADQPSVVRGWREKSCGQLHCLRAELIQGGEVKATAAGRFMAYPEDTSGETAADEKGERGEEDRHHHL